MIAKLRGSLGQAGVVRDVLALVERVVERRHRHHRRRPDPGGVAHQPLGLVGPQRADVRHERDAAVDRRGDALGHRHALALGQDGELAGAAARDDAADPAATSRSQNGGIAAWSTSPPGVKGVAMRDLDAVEHADTVAHHDAKG